MSRPNDPGARDDNENPARDDDDDDLARDFLVQLIRHLRHDARWIQAIGNPDVSDEDREALGADGERSFNDTLEALRAAIGGAT